MSSGEPEGDVTQPPRPRKIRGIGYVVGMVILVVLIAVGSFFFIYKNTSAVPAGNGKATPSPSVKGGITPSPTDTETPTLAIPTQAIFYDQFLDNSHFWLLSNQAGYIRTLTNGMLTLSDTNPQTTLIEGLPNNAQYTNFSMTVDFTVTQGDMNDSVGLYLRGDSNLDYDYRVDVNGNNTFDIVKEYLGDNNTPQSTTLDGPHSPSILHPPGHQNTITVIMKGPALVLLINGTVVSSITDSDYTSGQIALFARHGATSDGVTVAFSRVEVDYAPEQLPQ